MYSVRDCWRCCHERLFQDLGTCWYTLPYKEEQGTQVDTAADVVKGGCVLCLVRIKPNTTHSPPLHYHISLSLDGCGRNICCHSCHYTWCPKTWRYLCCAWGVSPIRNNCPQTHIFRILCTTLMAATAAAEIFIAAREVLCYYFFLVWDLC